MNGIHEVTGSIPVWSTILTKDFAVNYLQTAPALETLKGIRDSPTVAAENTALPGGMGGRCVLHCLT
jgi:hypothetical protein